MDALSRKLGTHEVNGKSIQNHQEKGCWFDNAQVKQITDIVLFTWAN
jgi:hypothetical protein